MDLEEVYETVSRTKGFGEARQAQAHGLQMNRIAISGLSLSAVAFVALLASEGYTDKAVIPVPGDVPTIGFGTTENVRMGDTITPPKAVARALRDTNKYEGAVKRCVKVPLHQYEYDAYTQLAYNIGPTAFCNSTLVKRLNDERYAEACAEISRWDKMNGKTLRGLTLRRQKERALCEGAESADTR
jgi:lysozyme